MRITCRLVGGPFDGEIITHAIPKLKRSRSGGVSKRQARHRHILVTKYLPEDLLEGKNDNGFIYQSKVPWDGHAEMELHCVGTISDRRGVDIDCRDPVTAPSPAQIAALCLEIQAGWSDTQRKKAGTFREKVYRRSELQHSGDEG